MGELGQITMHGTLAVDDAQHDDSDAEKAEQASECV